MSASSSSSSSRISSSTRLYSIAALFGLSLLQLVPQFSVMERLRTISRDIGIDHNNTSLKRIIPPEYHDKNNSEFNYEAFWQDALAAARASLHAETQQRQQQQTTIVAPSSSTCPKVYVYDLPPSLVDVSEKNQEGFGKEVSLKGTDNKDFKGYLFQTNQYAFPSILEERLRHSKQCQTTDPNDADLFYAPIFPAPKMSKHWNATCQNVSGEVVRDALPFLNASNACRHFFAIGKGHYNAEPCQGWYSYPIKELKPFLRLAYTHYKFFVDSNGAHDYDPDDSTNAAYPNLYSVPYPSSLHFRTSITDNDDMPQFRKMNKRKVLMLFMGKDTHGDVPVRQRIRKLCQQRYKNSKNVCEYIETFRPHTATAKSRATFCLEPAGDSPWRKSISDSIVFGCIPVLFSQMTDNVTPWFWDDWKARGRVLIPREDFVAGRIDLQKLLQSIPSQLLELMQSTLQAKARQYQYSVDDDEHDGIRVTLNKLHRVALDMEQRGVCGY